MSIPEVSCVNIGTRTAVMEDGQCLPITDVFDEDGDDCDLEDAVACVAGPDKNGMWVTIGFREWESVTVQ